MKNALILTIAFLGLSNVAAAAICATGNNGTTTTMEIGNGSWCSSEPDYYATTIYSMHLCTSIPSAPTPTSVAGTESCVTTFSNASGALTQIKADGKRTDLIGTTTRPPNGVYTHGYMYLDKKFIIGDAREYTLDAKDSNGNVGRYCATTSTKGVAQCSSAPIALSESDRATSYLTKFSDGIYEWQGMYLVGADKKLSTSDDDNGFLVGAAVFSPPITITNNSEYMDLSFKAAVNIDTDDSQTPPLLKIWTTKFDIKVTVK